MGIRATSVPNTVCSFFSHGKFRVRVFFFSHGKFRVCRVPDIMAKDGAHDIPAIFGSDVRFEPMGTLATAVYQAQDPTFPWWHVRY